MRIETLKPGQAADGGPRFIPPERSPAPHLAKLVDRLPNHVEMVNALRCIGDGREPESNLRGLSPSEIVREALRQVGQRPANDPETLRAAMSTAPVAALFDNLLARSVVEGYSQIAPSLDDVVLRVELEDFRERAVFIVEPSVGLRRLSRGTPPDDATLVVDAGSWRLSRFAARIVADEMDFIDNEFLSLFTQTGRRLGRAARLLEWELAVALLMENAELADGKAVFHESRGNLGIEVLSAESVGAAVGAIMGRTSVGPAGETVHLGIRPVGLLVGPGLAWAARRLLADVQLGDDNDLRLLVDSRLSAGARDPESGETYPGSATQWYLLGDAKSVPAILLGTLMGSGGRPMTTPFMLDKGAWGRGWSINFDLAATVGDPRGLFKSTGEGNGE